MDKNVAYVHFVKEDLQKAGHFAELSFTLRKMAMQNLDKIIIADKVLRRKNENAKMEGLPPDERKAFIIMKSKSFHGWGFWPIKIPYIFVNGIFFAPSLVKQTVPHLQTVFMADASHLHFGKYVPFSCFGMTANSNTSPAAFEILFGNKNTRTWRQF